MEILHAESHSLPGEMTMCHQEIMVMQLRTEADNLKSVALTYTSRIHTSSQDTRYYAPPPRDYGYYDYGPSSRSEQSFGGNGYYNIFCECDGYCGDHSEHPSRHSYRDAYQSYGTSHGGPPAQGPQMSYGGSHHYDYNSIRDRYGRSQESYSRSCGVVYSSGHEHGGRKE
ncbi:RNA-binding motif protein, Y chromosome, family 1 member B-like [Piliocolobus tephrosceles]|uniref:RNA-binding motif protein, Y chromosome, family 1 member B-like n=1 Tax=Piliocolobus tephrosceles TaxID=591936 RepID=UPI000E6B1DD5|nr:RNA-binding motif protein, Y chromosome, family 1 member B-like [Piliocolobus tephrosceles]